MEAEDGVVVCYAFFAGEVGPGWFLSNGWGELVKNVKCEGGMRIWMGLGPNHSLLLTALLIVHFFFGQYLASYLASLTRPLTPRRSTASGG